MKKSSRNQSGSGKNTKGTGRGGNNGGRPIHGLAAKSFSERQERRDAQKKGGRNQSSGRPSREHSSRDTQANRETRQPRERQSRDDHHSPSSRLKISLFGVHAVREAIMNPARDIRNIYITEQLEDDIYLMIEQAQAEGLDRPEPQVLVREALDRALPRGTVHQGIACDAAPLDEIFLPDLIRKGAAKERSVLVLLDQVTDPHNMGAIMRSACAFGADGIIVQSRHAPELNGIVAKTASGAVEHIPVAYETNLARAIETLKEAGYFALALDERGELLQNAPLYEKTLLILGAEGPGLRPLIKDHCDLLLRLPTSGGLSSLNVSNAAAVALYAVSAIKD